MTKKLLMIDDDPDFVSGIKAILDKGGFEVDVAYNPKDGMNALQTKQYDLLLLDIMMGRGAEGIMIARKLRKDVKLRELPVLIMTGMREQIAFLFPGEPIHPRFVEIDELVEKPVEPKMLLEKVNSLIAAAESKKAGRKQRIKPLVTLKANPYDRYHYFRTGSFQPSTCRGRGTAKNLHPMRHMFRHLPGGWLHG